VRVALSGSHGLVGSALARHLSGRGDDVVPLSRGPYTARHVAGFDAVVHLGGASVGGRRWNESYKQELRRSRIESTAALAAAIAGLDDARPALLTASAIGYYGADAGSGPRTETDAPGTDFLARLCVDWEEAAEPARLAGARVVHARFGIVLSAAGGVLARQLPLFRAGVGGRIGPGTQYQSWVSRRDVVSALVHLMTDPGASGPYNVTAPEPVTNAEMTRALARALHRPAVVPLPAFALRLALGREMAEVVPLSGQRVLPARLQEAGFGFADPELGSGLATALSDRS